MPKLVNFLYCESIQNELIQIQNVQKAHIIGPLQVLAPLSIPGNFSFAISFGILGVNIEIPNHVHVLCQDPSGSDVFDSGVIDIPMNSLKPTTPKGYHGINMAINIQNIAFRSPGEYNTIITFNDEVIGNCTIPVVVGEWNV